MSTTTTTTTTSTTTTRPQQAESRSADYAKASPNAVVYSYENEFGQKTKVGVVLDVDDLTPGRYNLSWQNRESGWSCSFKSEFHPDNPGFTPAWGKPQKIW